MSVTTRPLYTIIFLSLYFFSVNAIAQNIPPDGEYVKEWLMLGPFFPADLTRDFLAEVGGEVNARPQEGDSITTPEGETLTWKRYTASKDALNIFDAIGHHRDATAYAFCILHSEAARTVRIGFGFRHEIMVWINGRKVYSNRLLANEAFAFDKGAAVVDLRAGENFCLVKVSQASWWRGWRLSMRVLPSATTLVMQLDENRGSYRDVATVALAHIGEAAVTPLIDAWRNQSIKPTLVSQALIAIGSPATPALREALNDSDERIRVLALGMLGQIDKSEGKTAIRQLDQALESPNPIVRFHAAWNLMALDESYNHDFAQRKRNLGSA